MGDSILSENCEEKFIEITDFSKCTEHPFTYILEQLKCASKTKEEYKAKVPAGTIPLNILMMYADKYGVEVETKDEDGFTTFVFRPKQ